MRFIYVFLLLTTLWGCESKLILKEKIIGILPYKGITNRDIDSVKSVLENTYHLKTIVLEQVELPKQAYITVRSTRYRTDSLIRIQARQTN